MVSGGSLPVLTTSEVSVVNFVARWIRVQGVNNILNLKIGSLVKIKG